MGLNIGRLRTRLIIEQRTVTRDAATGAQLEAWATWATVWADVEESPTAFGIKTGSPLEVASYARPSRITIRYRDGMDRANMRLVMPSGRHLRILGMAEVTPRLALKISAADWSQEP